VPADDALPAIHNDPRDDLTTIQAGDRDARSVGI